MYNIQIRVHHLEKYRIIPFLKKNNLSLYTDAHSYVWHEKTKRWRVYDYYDIEYMGHTEELTSDELLQMIFENNNEHIFEVYIGDLPNLDKIIIKEELLMTPSNLSQFFANRPALSKAEFAREAGISVRLIDYILNGKRKLTTDTAEKIRPVMVRYGWK